MLKYRDFIRCFAVVCTSWKYAVKCLWSDSSLALFNRSLSGGALERSLTSHAKCWNAIDKAALSLVHSWGLSLSF